MSEEEETSSCELRNARGVVTLTLNRPQAFNALSESDARSLQRELDAIARDESVRAIVIAAEGKAFLRGSRPSKKCVPIHRCSITSAFSLDAPRYARHPAIAGAGDCARVQGIATAAGCHWSRCAISLSPRATPGSPLAGKTWAFFVPHPAWQLSRNVLRKQAFEMLGHRRIHQRHRRQRRGV